MRRDTFSYGLEDKEEQEGEWEEVDRMLPAVWLPEEEGESLEG